MQGCQQLSRTTYLNAPNEDLEDGADDEPSLSLGYGGAGEGRYCGEIDLEVDDPDSEPDLGWIHGLNQGNWGGYGLLLRLPEADARDGLAGDASDRAGAAT